MILLSKDITYLIHSELPNENTQKHWMYKGKTERRSTTETICKRKNTKINVILPH